MSKYMYVLLCILATTLGNAQGRKEEPVLLLSPMKRVIRELQGIAVQVAFQPAHTGPSDAIPWGSGFWISDSGYIATCWHVVSEAPDATFVIRTPTESNFEPPGPFMYANWLVYHAKVAAKNEEIDIAILTIPLGTQFQFRSFGDQALVAAGVTMPPWPGEGEAIVVKGKWKPTLPTLP